MLLFIHIKTLRLYPHSIPILRENLEYPFSTENGEEIGLFVESENAR